MYCTYCGRETSGLINYCSSCGYRLDSRPTPRYATSQPAYAESLHQAQPLQGISGWLMFFCILTTILGPITLLIGGHPDRMLFVRTMFGLVTGAVVWSMRPFAMHWLRTYFFIGFVTRLAALYLFSTQSFVGDTRWFEQFIGGLVGLFLMMAWIAYFHLSDRVKATFGSNL